MPVWSVRPLAQRILDFPLQGVTIGSLLKAIHHEYLHVDLEPRFYLEGPLVHNFISGLLPPDLQQGFANDDSRFSYYKDFIPQQGDRVALLRQGKHKGIVGFGRVSSGQLERRSEKVWGAPCIFLNLVGPYDPPFVSAEQLTALETPGVVVKNILGSNFSGKRLIGAELDFIEACCSSILEKSLSDLCYDHIHNWVDGPALIALEARNELSPLERKQLIDARRGQGEFKRRVYRIEQSCRVTGIGDLAHLEACHILSWRSSDDAQKLDGNNGLMLAPHVHHLFDRGDIGFTSDGRLLVSPELDRCILQAWNICSSTNVGGFSVDQQRYLAFHRKAFGLG